MRKAKVIALVVGGRNNKKFRSGEMVHEGHFPPGNFDLLIQSGFIKEEIEAAEIATEEAKASELKALSERAEALGLASDASEEEILAAEKGKSGKGKKK